MRLKRIRRLAAAIAAAVLLPVLPAARSEGVTRCLLIGCDTFAGMPSTEPVGANNVETMEALVKDFLPGEIRVTRSLNGPGTAEELERLVCDTFRDASDGDTALIYLSTHGVALKGGETGMALLLSDGREDERLRPERLRQILDGVPGDKVLIVDACHSGALIGREEGANYFADGRYRVLVSSSAEEESWFWNMEEDRYTGTGYFTAALESALRASDPEQIDPDGSGEVSLEETAARLREIHGASTICCWPEGNPETLFRLPEDRKAGKLLQGLAFGETEPDGDALVLPVCFRAGEPVRVVYQLAPSVGGRWDFEHAVVLPDREKTGLTRGLLSPGTKERKIRLSVKSLGAEGRALMQIISFREDGRTPAAEAGRVVLADPGKGNLPPGQEKTEE